MLSRLQRGYQISNCNYGSLGLRSSLNSFRRYQSSSSLKSLVEAKEENQLSTNKQKKSRKSKSQDESSNTVAVTGAASAHLTSTQPKCIKVRIGPTTSGVLPKTKSKKKFTKFPRVAKLDDRFSNQHCNLDILYSGYKPLFKTHEFSNKQQKNQDKMLGIPNQTNTPSKNSAKNLFEEAVTKENPIKAESDQININISVDREAGDDALFPKNFSDLITNFTPYQNHKILALRKYAKFTPWCSSALNLEWYRDWEILPDSVLQEMKPYRMPIQQEMPLVKSRITKNLELVPVKSLSSGNNNETSDVNGNETLNELKLEIYNKEKEKINSRIKGRKKPLLKLMKLKKTLFD